MKPCNIPARLVFSVIPGTVLSAAPWHHMIRIRPLMQHSEITDRLE